MSVRDYINGMTKDRILRLAARTDGFRTHRYRWREEKIVQRCHALQKDGLIRRVTRTREEVVWKITDQGRTALSRASDGEG